MVTCPNCSHQNPDGATHCEACFSPLPIVTEMACPNCGATVQSDATFCGHCGYNLKTTPPNEASTMVVSPPAIASPAPAASSAELIASSPSPISPETDIHTEVNLAPPPQVPASAKTQLQRIGASLLHVQTNISLELPTNLQVIHVGKPNNMIPPDIDVSGFPDSDIVSRVHADIRIEGDAFYFEDTGSSNGTYINNIPLPAGNRHRLRHGDRISLGKGDKVSFIFQLTST